MTDITCKRCQSVLEGLNGSIIRFCPSCGSPIPIDSRGEQPFHMGDKDVQDLMKVNKVLEECNDILKRINEKDSKDQRLSRTVDHLANLTKQEWLSNDPELYRNLKKL